MKKKQSNVICKVILITLMYLGVCSSNVMAQMPFSFGMESPFPPGYIPTYLDIMQHDAFIKQAAQRVVNSIKYDIEYQQKQEEEKFRKMHNCTMMEWYGASNAPQGNYNNNNEGYSKKSTSGTSSGKSCYSCHGIKKCWTCNGERTYRNPLNGQYVKCPNCTDGLCHVCHGTGRL